MVSGLEEKYHQEVKQHFDSLPDRYFQFKDSKTVISHIKSIQQFKEKENSSEGSYPAKMKWVDHLSRGYSELVIVCRNRPLLLERVCCALASQEITIISADVFTRKDGIVCDTLRVSTVDWKAIQSKSKKQNVLSIFSDLLLQNEYDPEKYLKKKKNILRKDDSDSGIPFPVRSYISNDMSELHTTLNIQGLDRIGLLHDLFLEIAKLGLATVSARICTEKGAALNTLHISYPSGGKIENPEEIKQIESRINAIIH